MQGDGLAQPPEIIDADQEWWHSRSPTLGALLVVVAVGFVAWAATSVPNPLEAWLAGLNAIGCLLGAIRAFSGSLRPTTATYFIFTFAWLGVAPIYQLATNTASWFDYYAFDNEQRVITGLAMNLTATACFALGAELARQREKPWGFLRDSAPVEHDAPRVARIRGRVLAVLVAVELALTPYAISVNGGLASLFSTRDARSDSLNAAGVTLASVGGAQYALANILPGALGVATTLLSIYLVRQQRREGRRVGFLVVLALIISVLVLILFANPLSNTRFISAAALGSVVLALFRPRRGWGSFFFVIIGFSVTLLIYPLASVFRGGADTSSVKVTLAAFGGIDFDGFQQVLNTITYVQDIGHSWGSYILSATLYFIPRSAWTWKQQPASIDVATNAHYYFTNLSLPIHAEFYLEFGWVGIVLGMLLLGYAAGRADSAYQRHPDSKLALITPYFALSMLAIVRGPLGSLAPLYLTIILLLAIGIKGSPRRAGEAGEQPGNAASERVPADPAPADPVPADPVPHRESAT